MMAALQSAGITDWDLEAARKELWAEREKRAGAECQVDALSPGGPEADQGASLPLGGDVQGERPLN